MREKFSLPYYEDELKQLLKKEIDIETFLEKVFFDQEGITHSEMCGRLMSYHSDDGGAPDVSDYEIVDVKFNYDTLKGSFETEFQVYYFYGCSDLNNDEEDSIMWDFTINRDLKIVEFLGEEPWKREPEGY